MLCPLMLSPDHLHVGMGDQDITGDTEQRKLTTASGCLHRPQLKSAARPQQLPPDPDHALVQIHIAPAQAEHLATTKPV